ncbi:MAG: DNA-3-methyladenine glycosylase 2 [Anaerolineae bacterium]|nr:DNA-3-methyladenine glycosylase 2 [Anaerolineae bacterium]
MQPLFVLHPRPPYAFDTLLAFVRRYAHPVLHHAHADAYRHILRIDDRLALIEVRSHGTTNAPQLAVNLLAATDDIPIDVLQSRLAHILAIDVDRASFFEYANQHQPLASVIAPLHGLPLLRTDDLFEALMCVIIEQQIAWKTALRAQRWLLEWAGHRLDHDSQPYYAFPTPAQIAAASVDDLKPLKITFGRMRLMISLAEQVASGQLDLASLTTLSPLDCYHALLKLKGIGHWTAAVIVSRAMGRSPLITYNDVALQAAVNYLFFDKEGRTTPEAVQQVFAPLGDYAAEAADYTLIRWVFERY